MSDAPTLLLELDQVSVPGRLAPLSLSLAPGVLVVVVGENGAGKTTLLDVLAGVLPPPHGAVRLDGVLLSSLRPRERARLVASLGQERIELEATVAERIAQGLAPRRGSGALLDESALERVRRIAEELGVSHLLGRELPTLSGGERRRVDVARALVDEEAACFILDEPHAGVDVRHQSLVTAALRRRAGAGRLVVTSVHDLSVAAALADRLLGLKDGRVLIDGAPEAALTPAGIEALYGVRGAKVLREGDALVVALPR
jgi:iron complex transport system ATP-binding protein